MLEFRIDFGSSGFRFDDCLALCFRQQDGTAKVDGGRSVAILVIDGTYSTIDDGHAIQRDALGAGTYRAQTYKCCCYKQPAGNHGNASLRLLRASEVPELFPLDGGGRFVCQIVKDAADARNGKHLS